MRTTLVPLLSALLLIAPPTARGDAPADTVDQLARFLKQPDHPPLADQPFARAALSRDAAAKAAALLWEDRLARLRAERAAEFKDKRITAGDLVMPFAYTVFGDKPKAGRSLFISMHGGGGTAKAVNDQQWENQKRLYRPAEGVYLAPRAPTDHWNLWHEAHVDAMFNRIIEDCVAFEGVDPDRVYLMGYSAGGDGVYQLAPRMADRFAAASMMAGHPNDASPLGLRNLPFAIHVGALDGGFKRNAVAAEWGVKLDALAKADAGAYEHLVKLHEGKAHWMDRQDAEAVPWMAGHRRDAWPKKVVWKQSTVAHDRLYWLAVPPGSAKPGALIEATVDGQRITITSADVPKLTVRLDDRLLNLDQPVSVWWGTTKVFDGPLTRSVASLSAGLDERADPGAMFAAQIEVTAPGKK